MLLWWILVDVRVSPAMWPCKKYFTHLSVVIYFFVNLDPKTETANRWETTNSKSPRPIIMIGQSETGSSNSHIIFITLFSGMCTTLPCPCYQPQHTLHASYQLQHTQQKCWAKTILWTKPSCFDFCSSNFNVHGCAYWCSKPGGCLADISHYDYHKSSRTQ